MKIRSRWAIRLIGRVIAFCARGYFRLFVRHVVRLETPGTEPYAHNSPEHFLYCLWHDAILGIIFGRQPIDMAGLVSQHEDGSYVADAMECVNLVPIRGSSRRGGTVAMKQMMAAADHLHIAIATDGPRGPRHVVKEGIVFLSAQTGKAIVPVAVSANRAWRPWAKWTDMVIPKPFSTMYVLAGKPMVIPAEATREEREEWRQRLQAAMDELTRKANQIAAGESPESVIQEPLQKAA